MGSGDLSLGSSSGGGGDSDEGMTDNANGDDPPDAPGFSSSAAGGGYGSGGGGGAVGGGNDDDPGFFSSAPAPLGSWSSSPGQDDESEQQQQQPLDEGVLDWDAFAAGADTTPRGAGDLLSGAEHALIQDAGGDGSAAGSPLRSGRPAPAQPEFLAFHDDLGHPPPLPAAVQEGGDPFDVFSPASQVQGSAAATGDTQPVDPFDAFVATSSGGAGIAPAGSEGAAVAAGEVAHGTASSSFDLLGLEQS